jgi:hypothetical protein
MLTNETNIISVKSSELLKSQMKFIAIMQQIFGVLNIIGGVLKCLGIISAIIGVPMLMSGIKAFKSGSAFALTASSNREEDLIQAISNLHGYWKYVLISFICLILFFIIYIIIIVSMMSTAMSHYY